jgi:hypothetical protein
MNETTEKTHKELVTKYNQIYHILVNNALQATTRYYEQASTERLINITSARVHHLSELSDIFTITESPDIFKNEIDDSFTNDLQTLQELSSLAKTIPYGEEKNDLNIGIAAAKKLQKILKNPKSQNTTAAYLKKDYFNAMHNFSRELAHNYTNLK